MTAARVSLLAVVLWDSSPPSSRPTLHEAAVTLRRAVHTSTLGAPDALAEPSGLARSSPTATSASGSCSREWASASRGRTRVGLGLTRSVPGASTPPSHLAGRGDM